MAELFKLPNSSYDELVKIIKAYGREKEGVLLSLDDVTQTTGVHRTIVSGNNGFLIQVGIITEGNKKAATEIGRKLGHAYNFNVMEDIVDCWKEIINDVDFLNRMISAVRIRNGMDKMSFLNHILYSSGQNDTKRNKTGAGAIVDILKNVNILKEEDGKLTVIEEDILEIEEKKERIGYLDNETDGGEKKDAFKTLEIKKENNININININCNVDELDMLNQKIEKLLEILKGE